MKNGDKIRLLVDIHGVHAYPPKYQVPKEAEFTRGMLGVVEEVYPNGGGILNFDGKKLMTTNLIEKVESV